MVAGEALLALAGPIGWAMGGAALVGGTLFARSKNKASAEEANQKRRNIETETKKYKAAYEEITRLYSLTSEHVDGMKKLLAQLKAYAYSDYTQFESGHKNQLGALINHVRSLTELLNKKVDV